MTGVAAGLPRPHGHRDRAIGTVIETLDADGHGQEIAIAWIAKEELRDALNLRARLRRSQPYERQVRGRLFTVRTSRDA